MDDKGQLLGHLPDINTPVFSRAPAYDPSTTEGVESPDILAVYSYCLSWRGKYLPVGEPSGSNSTQHVSAVTRVPQPRFVSVCARVFV